MSVSSLVSPSEPRARTLDALSEPLASLDLFDLGRRAAQVRDERLGMRGSFVRTRQLVAEGTWRGPRDAAESYVDAADVDALGGVGAAASAGVGLVVGQPAEIRRLAPAAIAAGVRLLVRLPYSSVEDAATRRARFEAARAVVDDVRAWGVMPTPEGEPEGLDTLRLVALARLELRDVPHLTLDVAALGPRLAQMALGFGGDELWAPIVAERALRLGANANNPALTRKEAANLIRAAGLTPRERVGAEAYEEIQP